MCDEMFKAQMKMEHAIVANAWKTGTIFVLVVLRNNNFLWIRARVNKVIVGWIFHTLIISKHGGGD